ncbi:MAG: 6-bladed beta-propeller, partial [Balneolaceae bacterium]|nr:6-bladed beta-propeller [Balneolaceae bacterium]
MHPLRASVVITFCILFQACTSSPDIEIPEEIAGIENVVVIPDDSEPEQVLQPKKVAEFGDSENVLIGWIRSIAVDDQGRVFIADSEQEMIQVFGPDGGYLQSVGREGDGPGEFRGITQIRTD